MNGKWKAAKLSARQRLVYTITRTNGIHLGSALARPPFRALYRVRAASRAGCAPDRSHPTAYELTERRAQARPGEIYVMNVDGSLPTRLTNNPAEEYYPAWSPSGNRIAFVSNRDGNVQVYLMKPDGSLQTRVTNDGAFDADTAWTIAVIR